MATNGTELEHEPIEALRASDLLQEALGRLPDTSGTRVLTILLARPHRMARS